MADVATADVAPPADVAPRISMSANVGSDVPLAAVAPPISMSANVGSDLPLPPLSGLGNYKGVMLCNRPDAVKSQKLGPNPFRSAVSATHGQPIGLPPCKELPLLDAVNEVCPALKKHAAWLKVLKDEMKKHKVHAAAEKAHSAEKFAKIKKMSERQRDGVRKAMQAQRESLAEDLGEAVQAPKLAGLSFDQKPIWALTKEEKEEYDVKEADNLLDFAEGLDFDRYVHDMEFRQALETLAGRAKVIDQEQQYFKDELVKALNAEEPADEGVHADDSASHVDERTRDECRKRQREPMEIDDDKETDMDVRSQVDRVLASNTEIRNIHSKESVKKIIEKQNEKRTEATDIVKTIMNMDSTGKPPNPTIITHDPSQIQKEVDPSMLPFLYRSPAI